MQNERPADVSAARRREAGAFLGILRGDYEPWQRLNFLPDPHQQGSLRPRSLCSSLTTVPCVATDVGAEASAVAVEVAVEPAPTPAAAITSAPAAVSCW